MIKFIVNEIKIAGLIYYFIQYEDESNIINQGISESLVKLLNISLDDYCNKLINFDGIKTLYFPVPIFIYKFKAEEAREWVESAYLMKKLQS